MYRERIINFRLWFGVTGLFLFVTLTPVHAVETLSSDMFKQALSVQHDNQRDSIETQKQINQLDDETSRMLKEYRTTLREAESIEIYNRQLQKLLTSQQENLQSLDKQLAELNTTEREVVPFMLRMLDTLEKFVELDLPFLLDERRLRVHQLRALINDADATLAEKYRRIMEAYLIEADYGHSIEAYRAKLSEADARTVEFLRIGRLALFYLSLDKQQTGRWNAQTASWEALSNHYLQSIDQGIRIAQKQAAPQLLELPISGVKHDR